MAAQARPGPPWRAGVFVLGLALLVAWLVLRNDPSRHGPRLLRHQAVERVIEDDLGASGVLCNHGQDFALHRAGDAFTCTSRGGRVFTVRITDPAAGTYTIS